MCQNCNRFKWVGLKNFTRVLAVPAIQKSMKKKCVPFFIHTRGGPDYLAILASFYRFVKNLSMKGHTWTRV